LNEAINPTLTNLLLNGYEVKDIKDYLGYTYNDFKNNKIYELTFKDFYTPDEQKLPASRAIENEYNLLSEKDKTRLEKQKMILKQLSFKFNFII